LIFDDGKYKIMVPKLEKLKKGAGTNDWQNADGVDLSEFYVASESDSAATINQKLSDGLHLILQPGQYKLEDSINVSNADTIVFGMGMATLIPQTGKPAITVANVDNVRVSGLILQAGPVNSPTLLKWGEKGYQGSNEKPGFIQDVFARVGGPDHLSVNVQADIMIQVNSGNTIIDDVWLWRADHSIDGLVKDSQNPVQTGLQVNGDNVKGYGLACEHTLGNMLEWNGNMGETYFYQSEFPYDVTQENYGDKEYAAYVVGEYVVYHYATGVGAYTYFRDNTVTVKNAIKAPIRPDTVHIYNPLGVFLSGNGGIENILNGDGNSVNSGTDQARYHCNLAEESEDKFMQD